MLLAQKYGPIFQLTFPGENPCSIVVRLANLHRVGGRTSIFVSDLELVDEVCDQKRFHKAVKAALLEVRHLTVDGLFTAFHGEQNWAVARQLFVSMIRW